MTWPKMVQHPEPNQNNVWTQVSPGFSGLMTMPEQRSLPYFQDMILPTMTLSLLIDSDDWIVPISALAQQRAQAAQAKQRSALGGQHAYWAKLGQEVVEKLFTEAQSELSESPASDTSSPATPNSAIPSSAIPTAAFHCWEFVPGVALSLGEKRVVILTTEAIDGGELRVPQEWIDLPNWLGDYYVSIQILPDAQQAIVLGYATHKQLKQQGQQDPFDRSYSLDQDQLIDWDLFNATHHLYSAEQTRSSELLPLAETVPASLIQRLSQPKKLLPRLEIPFAQWGAILNDSGLRLQLEQSRNQDPATTVASATVTASPTALMDWLQGKIPSSWQGIEALPPRVLNARNRRSPQHQSSNLERATDSTTESAHAAGKMQYRTKTLNFSPCQTGAPHGDSPKEENSTVQPDIALVVGLATDSDDEIQVALSVEPLQEDGTPQAIRLRLLDEAGEEIAQAGATTLEHIDMSFTVSPGEAFALEVLSQGYRAIESFLL